MNLKTKITLGFLALLVLLGSIGGYAFYTVRGLSHGSRDMLTANFYSITLGQQMLQALDRMETAPGAPAAGPRFRQALTREAGNITEAGERALVDSLGQTLAAFQREPATPALEQLRAQTHRMIRLNTEALTRKNQQLGAQATGAGRNLLLAATLAVLLALLLVASVPEAAVMPLRKLTNALEHATGQNFDASIPVESQDEFGRVARAFNRMLVQLQEYRNSARAELETERNRARSIVNGLDEGLLLLDENGRILLANPVMGELLGVPIAQLLDQPAAGVAQRNELLAAMLRPLDAPRRAAAVAEAPLLTVARNGEEVFYRLAVQELVSFNEASDKMEFVGQVLTLRNVSDFKKLDQVKSNFLATVSHELKTPLSSINMSLKLLQTERLDAEERRRVTDGIRRETQRLLRLVSELLDVARLDSGAGIQLNFGATCLPDVVAFATATVQAQLDHRHLTLAAGLPADLPAVRADVEKTTWVLINLLANAIRYSPVGAAVAICAVRTGEFVQLTVQDHGPGIAAEHHERIFQRFAQVPSTTGPPGGSGLGLSIAREFIAAQGGRLWVESEPGRGSAFHFTLPLA